MSEYNVKSDYTLLRKRKQKTSKGDIYENNIMTILPMDDLFTDGQVVLATDSNFRFSVRTEQNLKKKHSKNSWLRNPSGETTWTINDVIDSHISDETKIRIKPNYSSLKDFAYYGSAVDMIQATVNHVIMYFPGELYFSKVKFSDLYGNALTGVPTYIVSNPTEINVDAKFVNESDVVNPYKYLCNHIGDYVSVDGNGNEKSGITITNNINTASTEYKNAVACQNGKLGTVSIDSKTITVCLVNGKKVLLHNGESGSIRPCKELVDEYFNTIDDFEYVLLNRESKPKYTAIFETPHEEETGNTYTMEAYTWPSENDWNPQVDTPSFEAYIDRLVKLAMFHDTYDSNNIWRMMTHEAIKNIDWTYFKQNSDVTGEDGSKIDSSKIEAIIQIYGRQYDGLKRYIDAIKSMNNVSYNQKNNMPDYFLTDVVELDGFEALLPTPTAQTTEYSDPLYSSMTIGYNEVDANNQFMRNLKLNAQYLNSLKGTRYGIQTMLALLGLISGSDYTITEYIAVAGKSDLCSFSGLAEDFGFVRNDSIGYPFAGDIAAINIYKDSYGTIDDNFGDLFAGIPVKAVDALVDGGGTYVVPWYENGKTYDGNWYFQSKGGWGKIDEKNIENLTIQDIPVNVETLDYDNMYDENQSYLKFTQDLSTILEFLPTEIKTNDVCYVNDISNIENVYSGVTSLEISGETYYSHYFKLSDFQYSTMLGESGWTNIPLSEILNGSSDNGKEVLYLESLNEKTTGNAPHIGKGEYDDGQEYLDYMSKIFKYSLENSALTFFSQNDIDKINTSNNFKITGITQDNRKCEYYYNPLNASGLTLSGGQMTLLETSGHEYNPEGGKNNETPAANSIINVKNVEIAFDDKDSKYWKEYITDVVIEYVKQMLPSTCIFKWGFK